MVIFSCSSRQIDVICYISDLYKLSLTIFINDPQVIIGLINDLIDEIEDEGYICDLDDEMVILYDKHYFNNKKNYCHYNDV